MSPIAYCRRRRRRRRLPSSSIIDIISDNTILHRYRQHSLARARFSHGTTNHFHLCNISSLILFVNIYRLFYMQSIYPSIYQSESSILNLQGGVAVLHVCQHSCALVAFCIIIFISASFLFFLSDFRLPRVRSTNPRIVTEPDTSTHMAIYIFFVAVSLLGAFYRAVGLRASASRPHIFLRRSRRVASHRLRLHLVGLIPSYRVVDPTRIHPF